MGYENVKSSRARLKERIIRVLGGKCVICGYDKCQQALEVHHIDPKEKDFTIAANTNRAYEQISNEIKKCVLLCANCHREVHAGIVQQEFVSSFDVNVDLEIKAELASMKGLTIDGDKIIHRCTCCGKEIGRDSSTKLCPECYFKTTRRVERPDRETLKSLIRTTPFTKIADNYGVTDNSIRKWCDSYGLPRTKTEINKYTNIQWAEI